MNCFTCESNTSAYLDDELDVANRRDVEAHLAECDRCRTEYEQHVAAWEAVTDRAAESAPDGLWDGIADAVGQRGSSGGSPVEELTLIVRGLAEEVRELRQDISDLRRIAGAAGATDSTDASIVRQRIRSKPELGIWTEPGAGLTRREVG